MSAILTTVLKATVGWIVKKGKDKAAEQLEHGDVTEKRFRDLVVREMDDIKSKLDGISRKELLASISFFREGIVLLFDVFEKVSLSRTDETVGDVSSLHGGATQELAKCGREIQLTDLDKNALKTFANAKKRFDDARVDATRAFNIESLDLSARILAMKYRIMATILGALDNYMDAFSTCLVCLEELHALPDVQKNFKVYLEKGLLSKISKEDRVEIISTVCRLNSMIYSVFLPKGLLCKWPCISKDGDEVDLLCDPRIAKVLRKTSCEGYCSPWSLGNEQGEKNGEIYTPVRVTTNSQGDIIVIDRSPSLKIKIFNKNGKFLSAVGVPVASASFIDVTTDLENNIYVLGMVEEKVKIGKTAELPGYVLSVFDGPGKPKSTIPFQFSVDNPNIQPPSLAIGKRVYISYESKVWVCDQENMKLLIDIWKVTDIIDPILPYPCTPPTDPLITGIAASEDRLLLAVEPRVHLLTANGDHLNCLQEDALCPVLAFHHMSGYALIGQGGTNKMFTVSIYSRDHGIFVKNINCYFPEGNHNDGVVAMVVTPDGHIAALFSNGQIYIW